MNESKKMQNLHQRAALGETLTAQEQTALRDWYKTLDREEDSILNVSQKTEDTEALREHLSNTTKQIVEISRDIETLVEENAGLRRENEVLRKILEARLVERAA